MDPDLDFIKAQLELMATQARRSMDPRQARQFALETQRMEWEYEAAVRVQNDKKTDEKAKKRAKGITDAINKNLPNMVKGMLSAASAFKSGDYIHGSAAIMDICASAMQMLGSLSASAGPYGAMFGALFSVVGQLLTYFGPKQPSLKDQIIEAMKGLNADEKLRDVKAHGDAVAQYMATISRIKKELGKFLPIPLDSIKNRQDFHRELNSCITSIKSAFTIISVLYDKWSTAEWLKDEKTQSQEKWPEILGVFCRTYADALLAHVLLGSLVDRALVRQRLEEASNRNPDYPNSPHEYDAIYDRLLKLEASIDAFPKLWTDGNAQVLDFMHAVEPVARKRGLFIHLGNHNHRNIYAATGSKATQSNEWTAFQMGPDSCGYRFATSVPGKYAGALKPLYHIFFCQDYEGGVMEHGWIDPAAVDISGRARISHERLFHDVWAIPSPLDGNTSFVYAARNDGSSGAVKLFEFGADEQLKEIGWKKTTKSGIVNVRALHHPPTALPDDPDRNAMPPELLQGNGEEHAILYGALAASGDIYVEYANTLYYVPAPWGSYGGIDVDPYYVWAFGPWGLACATHASVISCIRGNIKTPRWMTHSPEALIGDRNTHEGNKWWVNHDETQTCPPMTGVRSLSACQDGTLFACIHQRTVRRSQSGDHWVYTATDTPFLYTVTYAINVKDGSLQLGAWTRFPGGAQALQVQKLAIPCWSLFASLKAQLAGTPVAAMAALPDKQPENA